MHQVGALDIAALAAWAELPVLVVDIAAQVGRSEQAVDIAAQVARAVHIFGRYNNTIDHIVVYNSFDFCNKDIHSFFPPLSLLLKIKSGWRVNELRYK